VRIAELKDSKILAALPAFESRETIEEPVERLRMKEKRWPGRRCGDDLRVQACRPGALLAGGTGHGGGLGDFRQWWDRPCGRHVPARGQREGQDPDEDGGTHAARSWHEPGGRSSF